MNPLNIAKNPQIFDSNRLDYVVYQTFWSTDYIPTLKQQNQTWALQFKSLQNNNTAKIQPNEHDLHAFGAVFPTNFPLPGARNCSSVFNPLLYPASSNKLCGHLTEHFLILLSVARSATSLQITEIPKPVEIVRNINFIRIIARWEVSVCKFSSARCLRGCTELSDDATMQPNSRQEFWSGAGTGVCFCCFLRGLEDGIGEVGD